MGASCGSQEPAADLSHANKEIGVRIRDLECWILKAERDAKAWARRAHVDPSAKARAVRILKQKRQYEQYRDRLLGMSYNVQNTDFQVEQAEVSVLAAQALKRGSEQLRNCRERLGPVAQLENLGDSIQDVSSDLREAHDCLARDMGMGSADEDLEAEWQQLQAELGVYAPAQPQAQG
ncbi:unnamed protein product, partial [Prorocentrum cordatum]